MENSQNNPLSKFFRQPSIHIKLPSNGAFWPEGSLDLPLTNELPVYPMTTRDEIILRTPDALMNGSGVIDVIQSCCPGIKNAWAMPSIDVDAVLIAIRIASYGTSMDVETKCPHCGERNDHALDLQVCLASIHSPDYKKAEEVENLKITLKPVAYFSVNRENTIDFEEQKLLQALERADIAEEVRQKEIYDSMNRLIQIKLDTLCASTASIEMDDGTVVTNPEHIKEYYNMAPATVTHKLQTRLAEMNVEGGIKPQMVACSSCTQAYQVPVLFDYAAFFGKGF